MSARRTLSSAVSALLLLTAVPVLAADLTPEQVAKIRRDEKEAEKKVDEAHGNKKPGDMDNDERRQVIGEKAAAANGAYEKNGVSAKDYAQYTARMSKEDQERAQAEEKRLDDQAKADAEKKAAEQKGNGEIEVQQGFNDQNPVDLEQKEGAGPRVDYGAAAETGDGTAMQDQQQPSEDSSAKESGKSSKSGGGHKGGGHGHGR